MPKRIFLVLVSFFLLIIATSFQSDNTDNTSNDATSISNGNILISHNDASTSEFISENGLYIIVFRDAFDIDIVDKSSSLEPVGDFLDESSYDFAINAGYFTADFTHAGLFRIESADLVRLAPNDQQLTHVVDVDLRIFHSNAEYLALPVKPSNAFQTGPLFIDANIVQKQLIETSLNGSTNHMRSFFGVIDRNTAFIGVSTRKTTLNDLADRLLQIQQISSPELSVINLDGGSSVSLYARSNEDFSLGDNKILPYLLGITITSI